MIVSWFVKVLCVCVSMHMFSHCSVCTYIRFHAYACVYFCMFFCACVSLPWLRAASVGEEEIPIWSPDQEDYGLNSGPVCMCA